MISCSLQLSNQSDNDVHFRVMMLFSLSFLWVCIFMCVSWFRVKLMVLLQVATTSTVPKKYSVSSAFGVVLPRSTCLIIGFLSLSHTHFLHLHSPSSLLHTKAQRYAKRDQYSCAFLREWWNIFNYFNCHFLGFSLFIS